MSSICSAVRKRLGWAVFVAAVAAVALLVKGLYPADLPQSPNPDFVDNVFDNRGVLWAGRLLLVSATGVLAFGGIFIVVSIAIRMRNGEWLRRAGPFEISEGKLFQAQEEIGYWRQEALTNEREVAGLRKQLEQSREFIAGLQDLN